MEQVFVGGFSSSLNFFSIVTDEISIVVVGSLLLSMTFNDESDNKFINVEYRTAFNSTLDGNISEPDISEPDISEPDISETDISFITILNGFCIGEFLFILLVFALLLFIFDYVKYYNIIK